MKNLLFYQDNSWKHFGTSLSIFSIFTAHFFAIFTDYLPYMLIKGFKYLQKNVFPQKNMFYSNTVKCTMHYHSAFVFGSTRKKISKIDSSAWAKDALILTGFFDIFFIADPKTNALYLLNK